MKKNNTFKIAYTLNLLLFTILLFITSINIFLVSNGIYSVTNKIIFICFLVSIFLMTSTVLFFTKSCYKLAYVIQHQSKLTNRDKTNGKISAILFSLLALLFIFYSIYVIQYLYSESYVNSNTKLALSFVFYFTGAAAYISVKYWLILKQHIKLN
jgi:hypothetical protein